MDTARWVWEQPSRLTVAGDWRVTSRGADGIPYASDGRHLQTLIFGQCHHFQGRDRCDEVLRSLGERLSLDAEGWLDQRSFYTTFIRAFFGESDNPAWVKIANSRLSFRQRVVGPRGIARHYGRGRRRLFRAKYLGHEAIPLGDFNLPTRTLRMKYRNDVPRSDLSLFEVTIFRTLSDDGFGGPVACHENWIHLATRAREDHVAMRNGVNLAIKDYPAADTKGRMSPLVSLCRLSDDRKWVHSLCVSLCPGTGEALDFRSVTHRLDYYFRSDLSNAALVARAVTPGESEGFANG